MKNIKAINDVFVISTSGIPYYSGCFGGENCIKEPNHLLISGFLAAIFQFSMQFGQKRLREILFDEAQMAIEQIKIGNQQVLAIIFASKNIKIKELRKLTDKTARSFEMSYSDLIQKPKFTHKMSDFENFSEILNEMGIIKKRVMMEAPILNFCDFSSVSEKSEYIYCKKIQKDVLIEEELKYKTMDKCPLLIT